MFEIVVAIFDRMAYYVCVMNKTITETKVTQEKLLIGCKDRSRNARHNKSVVFVTSEGSNLLDEWFLKNEINFLDYKCKTWDWLCKKLNKIIFAEILKYFKLTEDDVSGYFSAYAGCTCPCSKGFVITINNFEQRNFRNFTYYWMDIFLDNNAINQLKHFIAEATHRFELEKLSKAAPKFQPEVELNLN